MKQGVGLLEALICIACWTIIAGLGGSLILHLSRTSHHAATQSRELLDLALVLKRLNDDIVQSTTQEVHPQELGLTIHREHISWFIKDQKLYRKGKNTSIYLEGPCSISFTSIPQGIQTRLALKNHVLKKVTAL